MAWIEVHQSLIRHPKVLDVAHRLRCDEAQVVGHLVALWCWAIDARPDGAGLTACHIAAGAGWKGSARVFSCALLGARLLDRDEKGAFSLHDWDDYAGVLIEKRIAQREANRERQRRARLARHADVTRESRRESRLDNASTQPNPTLPVDVSINDPGLPTAMRSSKESVSRRPPDGGASRTALTKTFFGATKTNEQVGALIDIGTSLGVELKGGPVAAIVREYGHGRPVLNALFEAAKYDAESPEQYMQGVLRNGRLQEGGGRSRRGARGSAASRGPDLEAWKRYAAGED